MHRVVTGVVFSNGLYYISVHLKFSADFCEFRQQIIALLFLLVTVP